MLQLGILFHLGILRQIIIVLLFLHCLHIYRHQRYSMLRHLLYNHFLFHHYCVQLNHSCTHHFRRSLYRHGGGVRDVVELEVEEHFETLVAQGADDFRRAAGEQFLADFDPAQFRVQLIGQLQCGVTGGEIQGDDDRSLADGHVRALRQDEIGAHCSGTNGAAGPDDR